MEADITQAQEPRVKSADDSQHTIFVRTVKPRYKPRRKQKENLEKKLKYKSIRTLRVELSNTSFLETFISYADIILLRRKHMTRRRTIRVNIVVCHNDQLITQFRNVVLDVTDALELNNRTMNRLFEEQHPVLLSRIPRWCERFPCGCEFRAGFECERLTWD